MWKTEIIFSTKSLYLYNNNNQILNISIFFTAGVHGNRSLSYYVYIFFFFPSITDKTFVLSFYHRQDFYCTWLYEQHDLCFVRSRNCLPLAVTWVHLQFWGRPSLLNYLIFCVVLFVLLVFVSSHLHALNTTNQTTYYICCVLCLILPVSLHCPLLIDP